MQTFPVSSSALLRWCACTSSVHMLHAHMHALPKHLHVPFFSTCSTPDFATPVEHRFDLDYAAAICEDGASRSPAPSPQRFQKRPRPMAGSCLKPAAAHKREVLHSMCDLLRQGDVLELYPHACGCTRHVPNHVHLVPKPLPTFTACFCRGGRGLHEPAKPQPESIPE